MSPQPEQRAEPESGGRNWRRITFRLSIILLVFWVMYFPRRMDRLFRAIPDSAEIASYNRGLAREWRHFARRADIVGLLTEAGVESADEWAEKNGIFHTLYWLTGKHSVFGFRFPEEGEGLAGIQLYGASYVGWKARPMELLWRMRWIPGLGKLETTPQGTRYYVFRNSRTMRRLGLVLSLDIYEGVLVGVLSNRPDAVRELHSRVRYDAELSYVFQDAGKPWLDPGEGPHRLWVPHISSFEVDPRLGPWRVDIASFGEDKLRIEGVGRPTVADEWFAEAPRLGEGAVEVNPIASEGPFVAALLPASLLYSASEDFTAALPDGGGSGFGALFLSGKPYEARLLGMALPSAQLRMPLPEGLDSKDWLSETLDRVNRWGALGPLLLRQAGQDSGSEVMLISPARTGMISLGESDSPFVSLSPGSLALGTNLGSYRMQRAGAANGEFAKLAEASNLYDDANAWLWADLSRFNAELRHVVAIYRLAARLAGSSSMMRHDDLLERVLRVSAAAASFGQVEMVLRENDAAVEALLRQL